MAITDPYVTVGEYKQAVDTKTSDNDLHIAQSINAASRFIDKICRRHFSQDDTVTTRIYDGAKYGLSSGLYRYDGLFIQGNPLFMLKDDISTSTGLIVLVDLNGDYVPETTLTLNTDFWLGPYNTSSSEQLPFNCLQVNPTSSIISTWPAHMRSISITAKFGWAAVPSPIKEACLILTREIIDLQSSGVMQSINLVDAALPVQRRTANIVDKLIEEYKRKVTLIV